MRHSRPQELLRVLASDHRVREKFVRAYGRLRNPAAHGKTAGDDKQQWIDVTSMGLTLLYELAFARIGWRFVKR